MIDGNSPDALGRRRRILRAVLFLLGLVAIVFASPLRYENACELTSIVYSVPCQLGSGYWDRLTANPMVHVSTAALIGLVALLLMSFFRAGRSVVSRYRPPRDRG